MASGSANLRNRFRGTIVGALVGDCLGAYWERQSWNGVHALDKVKEKIASQVMETKKAKAPPISYTDDTALTIALGDSLVECGKFNLAHCAQKYIKIARCMCGGGVSMEIVHLTSLAVLPLLK